MPTPCVITQMGRIHVRVKKDILEMGSSVQVNVS